MGNIQFSIPKEIVLDFKNAANIENFVETGTYQGGSCFWAAQYFSNVYTIEIDSKISKETSMKPDCPANIQFFVGNSKDVLPDLLKHVNGPSVFWLDGHWCNVTEEGKDMECPLMDELRALEKHGDSVILIDDARAFLGPLPPPHDNEQWPRIDEIVILLKTQFPNNLVTIVDDVIYCIPSKLIDIFNARWMKEYPLRFGNKSSILSKVKKAFRT